MAGLLASEIAGLDDDSLVFKFKLDEYLPLRQARDRFTKAVAAVDGVGTVRLHDRRHTCASLSIRAGANVKVLQKLLGDKTATQTLDRYGHLFPGDPDAVADGLDEAAADDLRTVWPPAARCR